VTYVDKRMHIHAVMPYIKIRARGHMYTINASRTNKSTYIYMYIFLMMAHFAKSAGVRPMKAAAGKAGAAPVDRDGR